MDRNFRVIAVVIAVAAIAFVVYRNEHHSLKVDTGPPVTVLVAESEIQKGTTGYAITNVPLYRASNLRQSQILNGAITDPSLLKGKVALSNISAGSQLTVADFRSLHP